MVNGDLNMMNGHHHTLPHTTMDGQNSSFNNIPLNSSTLKHNSVAVPQQYHQQQQLISQTLPRRPHSVAQTQQQQHNVTSSSFRGQTSGTSTPNKSVTAGFDFICLKATVRKVIFSSKIKTYCLFYKYDLEKTTK